MQSEYTAPSTGFMSPRLARPLLIAEYGAYCFKCGVIPVHGAPALCVDHIIPVARGGQNSYANYQFLCAPCNSEKRTDVADYRPGTRQLDFVDDRPILPMDQRARRQPVKGLPSDAYAYAEGIPVEEGFCLLSVCDAARAIGISQTQVRRLIKSGRLQAERALRPQGTVWLVKVHESDVASEAELAREFEGVPMDIDQDAPPRADSEETLGIIKALIQSHADTAARQGEMIAELREERGRLQAERDNAVARAERAEDALGHLRIDIRRTERLAEQMRTVADAQEAKANELEQQLAAARARPWWCRWLP